MPNITYKSGYYLFILQPAKTCRYFKFSWNATALSQSNCINFSCSSIIGCFHMTSRRPYLSPKTIKRRPCWCPKPIQWELNSLLTQTLSFVPINLHRCWSREWKHSILMVISDSGIRNTTLFASSASWKLLVYILLTTIKNVSLVKMYREVIAPCKGIRIPESGKFWPVESGILGLGIQNIAQGIRNPTKLWNPVSKFHWQDWNAAPGTRNPLNGIRMARKGIENPSMFWISLHGAKISSLNCMF